MRAVPKTPNSAPMLGLEAVASIKTEGNIHAFPRAQK